VWGSSRNLFYFNQQFEWSSVNFNSLIVSRMLAAASQRRQLLVCYALVLATFVPRAAFNVLNVIANVNVVYSPPALGVDSDVFL
jgi:hypothetical protein